MQNPIFIGRSSLGGLCLALSFSIVGVCTAQTTPPDFTAPGVIAGFDRSNTFNLGPTGLRGWIYCNTWEGEYPTTGRISDACRQILVTTATTPATNSDVNGNSLAVDDVILGAIAASSGTVPSFTSDARKVLGTAITNAEKTGAGTLRVKRWRANTTTDVNITIPTLGEYSATAPYNCPKSAQILANTRNQMVGELIANPNYLDFLHSGAIHALALLASVKPGDPNYSTVQTRLQTYARALSSHLPKNDTWNWDPAYQLVFLAEYYLLTNDSQVVPTINTFTLWLVGSQSMWGTFNHNPGVLYQDGSGRRVASGYGPVNAVGNIANIAILLGKKALQAAIVNSHFSQPIDPEIDAAIARATGFIGSHVNKGGMNYGEHVPGKDGHYSNGKDPSAAVFFGLQADKAVQTEFFSRLAIGNWVGVDTGHGGQELGLIWVALGAGMGGEAAASGHFKQLLWRYDIQRRTNGSFTHDGRKIDYYYGSSTSDGTYLGNSDGLGVKGTAIYLLTYSLPLKRLYITGKQANPAYTLDSTKVANAVSAGSFRLDRTSLSIPQLFTAFGEYDPIVRYYASVELAARTLTSANLTTLRGLLTSADPNIRKSAAEALGIRKDTTALPTLVGMLNDPDHWVRQKAAAAIYNYPASTVSPHRDALINAFLANAPADPDVTDWTDPLRFSLSALSEVLFDQLASYTINAPKTTHLYPALRAGLLLPTGAFRGTVAVFARNRLNLTDLQSVYPELAEVASYDTPADRMFSPNCRINAMAFMAENKIIEGIPIALFTIQTAGEEFSEGYVSEAVRALASYGDAARYILPSLREIRDDWQAIPWYNTPDGAPFLAQMNNTITVIENAISAPATNLGKCVANSQIVTTTGAKAITLTGVSPRGAFSFLKLTDPANGTLTGTAPNFTYTPNVGFTGTDKFTFQTQDSTTTSDPATASIIVGSSGTGIVGAYFDNADFTTPVLTRTDAQINFDWGTGSPAPAIGADSFSTRWSGYLLAPETGTYTLSGLTSDGFRAYLNGVPVINNLNDQSTRWIDGQSFTLTAGQKVPLFLEYYENTGSAVAKLKWTGPSFAGLNGAIIPQAYLFENNSSGGPDTTAPVITTRIPADNTTGVAHATDLVAVFSENIVRGTGSITLKNLGDGTQTLIPVTDTAQVTISGATLIINPTALIVGGKNHAVQIDATAIVDTAGLSFAGITNDTTWNFTTTAPDTAKPTPNPMTFAQPPQSAGSTSISMTATTASDPSGVEYRFNNVTLGTSSPWQSSPVYTATGLAPSSRYTFTVEARDKSVTGNTTTASSQASSRTLGSEPPVTAGMTVWLPADSVDTNDLNQVRVQGSDTFVKQWKDCSSNSKHATQTTLGDQPKYIASGMGGKPVLRFDGGSNKMNLSDLSTSFPSAVSMFVVTTINNDDAYTLVKANPGFDEWWRWNRDGMSYPGFFRSSRVESYCPMPISGSHLFAISSSASAWEISIDGVSQGVAGGAYHAGGAPIIGNGSSGGGLNGDIAEVILYNRVLTPAEVVQVSEYLAQKYGVATSYGPPVISSLNPADNAAGVAVTANLVATFSEAIALGTGNITIKNLTDATQTVITLPNSQVTATGAVLTINPTANLLNGKNYAIQIDAAAVKDLANNAFAGIVNDTTWNFASAETIPPTVSTYSPADNATGVAVTSNLVATFSEAIAIGTGNITIKNLSDSTQTVITLPNAQVTAAGAVLTINPTADLLGGKNYAIQIAATAVKDLSNNAFAGIANDTTWNFATQSAGGPLDLMSVNFYAHGGLSAANYSSVTLEAGESAGVGASNVSGWQNYEVPWGLDSPAAPFALTSNLGATATLTLNDVRNGWTNDDTPNPNFGGSGDLMDSHANGTEDPYDESAKFDMTVSSIPYPVYDLIVYLRSNDGQFGDGTGKLVVNGGAVRDFTLPSGEFSGFVEITNTTTPGNYIIFRKLRTPSLTLRVWGNGPNHIGPAGFQIVKDTSGVLPPGPASNPNPQDATVGHASGTDLSWTAGVDAVSRNVYFGTNPSPGASEFRGNQTATTFDPGTLANATYYWRIDEVNGDGTTTGPVWSFSAGPPAKAFRPMPWNDMKAVATNVGTLKWVAGQSATASSHDVYFGTNPSPGAAEFKGNQSGTTFNPGPLTAGTTYYWRVDQVNAQGAMTGDVWSFTTPSNSANKVKIFILAGQSNMEGQGEIEPIGTQGSLQYTYNNDPVTYAHLKNGSNWAVRDDAWVWYNRNGTLVKGGLTTGFGADSNTIGPELQFGHAMGMHYGQKVLLIKTAWGGKSLQVDFRPPSADWNIDVPGKAGDKGYYFTEMLKDVVNATANLQTHFPTHNPADGFEIAGFAWHQGFNDLVSSSASAEYEVNMEKFIKDVRLAVGVPNLPFVIATTGQSDPVSYSEVEMAQLKMEDFTKYPAFNGNVSVVDAKPFWIPVSQSPTDQGYHWNRNAKSYYMIGDSLASAMLGLQSDTVPPTISTYSPADNAAGVAVTSNLVATFNEAIAIGTGNITIKNLTDATQTVITLPNAQVTVSGTVLTINPTADLLGGKNYAIQIAATAVKDLTNIAYAGIANDTTWNFATAETIPPTVSTYSPADNSTGVAITANLVATFSEAIAIGTGNITIKNLTDSTQTVIALPNAQVAVSGAVLTINPTADLLGGKNYAVQIAATAVKDLSNNAFAGIANDTTWNFATPDIIPPTVSTYSPADNATNVAVTSNLVATFNEAIAIGTGNITIKNLTDATQTVITLPNAQVTVSGAVLTINPTTNLLNGKNYAIQIAATAVKDLANNAFAGIANDTTWNFATPDIISPTVFTYSPADNAAAVAVAENLVATFSEAIAIGTGNITIKNLTDATQTTIAVTDTTQVSISGTVLTINPSANLLGAKNYAIQIAATAIKDPANNAFAGIANDTTWNFTSAVIPFVWTQTTGGAQAWANGANWQGGLVPSPITGDAIDFSTVNIAADTTLTLGADRTAWLWKFGDTGSTQNWIVSAGNQMILAGTTPTIEVKQNTTTLNNVVAGSSGLLKTGAGTLTLSGSNTYTGGLVLNAGTVAVTTASLNNNAITVNGTATLTATSSTTTSGGLNLNADSILSSGNNNTALTVNGVVTGSGTLAGKNGAGVVTVNLLNSGNDFSGAIFIGPTTVSNINAQILTVNSIGDSSATPITFGYGNTTGTANEQTFAYTGSSALTLSNRYFEFGPINTAAANGSGLIAASGATSADTLTIIKDLVVSGTGGGFTKNLTLKGSNTGNNTFAGKIADGVGTPIRVTKADAGRWILSGTNSYTGATTLTGGTLSVGASNNLGAAANSLVFNGGTLRITGTALTNFSGIGHAVSFTAAKAVGLDIDDASHTFTADQILNQTTGALTKAGAGTLVLDKVNTYTGATTISGGTLQVNSPGSLASASAVAVNGTSTLGGNGTIGGTVTVAATASLAPGASVGTLTIGGGLNISALANNGAGKLRFELGPIATSDKITVGGALNIGTAYLGFSDFDFSSLAGLQNGTYTLISYNTLSGTLAASGLSGAIGTGTGTLQIVGNSLQLVVSGVTTTSPWAAWAVGGVAFDADTNNDGVDNGMAWLLGATNSSENAVGKLPASTSNGTNLRLTFRCLKSTMRGGAVLKLQCSNDLGQTDPWTAHEAAVPDADGTVNGVIFDTTDDGNYINVIADIPAAGSKLFVRLSAVVSP